MLHINDEGMSTKGKESYTSVKFRFIFKNYRRKISCFFFFFGRGGGCDGRGGEVHQLLISEWIRLPSDCVWTEKRVQDTITRNIYI